MPQQPPPAPIPQALAHLTLGAPIEHGALSVTPLLGDDEPACDYLTLDEALGDALIQITEVSDAGSVPELRVRNHTSKPVLIVDGEELIGAKQNRVINLTVLVPAERETTIPVSCVEAGRWRRTSAQFASSPRTQFASGRAEKIAQVTSALTTTGERRSDQGAVWHAIEQKAARMRALSDTAAMSAIFEQYTHSVDEYVTRLSTVRHQRGAVFSVHGRATGIELFDRADVLRRLMPKLVRGYAIDAVDVPPRVNKARAGVTTLLDWVVKAETRTFPAIGEGFDVRLEGKSLVGAALVTGGRVVHLAAFAETGRGRGRHIVY